MIVKTYLKLDGLPEVDVIQFTLSEQPVGGFTGPNFVRAGGIQNITVRLGEDNGGYAVFYPLAQRMIDGRDFKYAILRGAGISSSGSQTTIREVYRYKLAPCWVNRFDWVTDEQPGCIVGLTSNVDGA